MVQLRRCERDPPRSELKAQAKPGELVTWLIYRPAYAARSQEMGMDLLAQLQAKAKQLGVRLVWFNSKEELIAYLNKGLGPG